MEESNTDTTGLSGSGDSGGVRRPSCGDNIGADEKGGEYGYAVEEKEEESCADVRGLRRDGEECNGDEGVPDQVEASPTSAPNNKPSPSPSEGSLGVSITTLAPLVLNIPTGTRPATGDAPSNLQSTDDLHARYDENTERGTRSGCGQLLETSLNASSSMDSNSSLRDNQPPGGETVDISTSISSSGRFQMKERLNDEGGNEVGAVQVEEQAPSLNRLFFRGRRSLRIRQRARREPRRLERSDDNGEVAHREIGAGSEVEEQDAPNATVVQDENTTTAIRRVSEFERAWRAVRRLERSDDNEEVAHREIRAGSEVEEQDAPNATVVHEEETRNTVRRASEFVNVRVRFSRIIQATLVEDVEEGEEGELVEAEPVSFMERKWKRFASAAGALVLVLLAISVAVFHSSQHGKKVHVLVIEPPTLSPTFDPRSTLEIVQERGHVLCGMSAETIGLGEGFLIELCRSVAAVVLGNPDSFVGVTVTSSNRWQHLLDRKVDLLVRGDTHTVEREIREKSTGSGFTFSTPYAYDGMIFAGNPSSVRCAEENMLYGECASLKICVTRSTTHHKFVEASFPPDYFTVASSIEERADMLFNGTCNALATDKSEVHMSELVYNAIRDRKYIWVNSMKTKEPLAMVTPKGNKTMSKEPLALVTRNTDREFSDIVNWVLQALLIGQEQGLRKDLSLCPNHTDLTSHDASTLVFMNAVYCVGNYMEIFDGDPADWKTNQINHGTGMLYSIPFGNVENVADVEPAAHSGMLEKIKSERLFTCGVVTPDDFEGDITRSGNLVGMSVDYCRTLSAAMFIGDSERVHFLTFTNTDNSSVVALANGTLDVLVGGKNQQEFDFKTSPSLGGLYFSTPYYFGNESASNSVSFYSMVTREDDVLFASFVNCVVMSTIYAQENDIQKHKSRKMPLISIFGSEISWALRNAISYSGSYDEIYVKHFDSDATEAGRGRNTLNEGRPLMLPFLNLSKL